MRGKAQHIIHGLRDGFPIALGYLAVSFSLGIIAAKAGLTSGQGFLSSFFTRASAGEYGTYSLIAVKAAFATDEVFGISIAHPGYTPPSYMYAAALLSTLFWATGCAIGITAGSLLPQHMVTALSMSLYGMFLAVFIPPARRDRNVLLAVIASFTLSGICAVAPVISQWSSGMRTVLLTVVISAVAAWLKPIKSDDNGAA